MNHSSKYLMAAGAVLLTLGASVQAQISGLPPEVQNDPTVQKADAALKAAEQQLTRARADELQAIRDAMAKLAAAKAEQERAARNAALARALSSLQPKVDTLLDRVTALSQKLDSKSAHPAAAAPPKAPQPQPAPTPVPPPATPKAIVSATPAPAFPLRARETHEPVIEKLGGTKQSEDAVARGLQWLSENQEEDGRWTVVLDENHGKHHPSAHDTSITALAILAYLAQDHRPDKTGPFQATVGRGLQFLVTSQRPDGDLRGAEPGTSAASGNMYDQGIATYALAEAAYMSHDPHLVQAATRGAEFIVKAQNKETGGWRYSPGEPGDTSVFGWQVMALHSSERIGFSLPEETSQGIDHYIEIASTGKHGLLAGYTPHTAATPIMTAQMAFARMLMGKHLSTEEMDEASDFLCHTPPTAEQADLYFWYHASLCMNQMQAPAWKSWNEKTRDLLLAMQKPDGKQSGYWSTVTHRGQNFGKAFSTALGTLTLEVYYRYLPGQTQTATPK